MGAPAQENPILIRSLQLIWLVSQPAFFNSFQPAQHPGAIYCCFDVLRLKNTAKGFKNLFKNFGPLFRERGQVSRISQFSNQREGMLYALYLSSGFVP